MWELTEADRAGYVELHIDEPGDDAQLLAAYCPTGTLPHTGGPIALLALLGTALMGGGLALHRLRA